MIAPSPQSDASPTASAAALRSAWIVLALLWPVALLNYLDRQMMAAMKFSIMADIPSIGLEENWGNLLAMFKWVYAGLSPLGGYIADRFSRRWVIGGSLFVWSAVTWATGHAHTYDQLLTARALMGISEACYIPAALALIADFHFGPYSLACCRHPSNGHLRRSDHRWLQRVRGGQSESRLAFGIRRRGYRRGALRGAANDSPRASQAAAFGAPA
jgi:hypothetical protein